MEDTYKSYRIIPDGSFPVWKIVPQAQGQVPVSLRGRYTDVPTAKRDIDKHITSLPPKKKAVKNGKSNSTS